jgi:hypothetical protein
MTEGEGQSESASAPEGVSGLRRNSDDVGWEYGVLVDINNKDKVKCILCDKQMCGGVYRLKQHIAQEGKNAKKCQGMKTTKEKLLEAQEKCKKALDEAKRKREEKTVRELELREEVHVSRIGGSEEVTCVGSSEPHKLGPIDPWRGGSRAKEEPTCVEGAEPRMAQWFVHGQKLLILQQPNLNL